MHAPVYRVFFVCDLTSELPRATQSCPELLRAAQSCQELPRAARSCPEVPGAAQSCQELPRAAQSCPELPRAARNCSELSRAAQSKRITQPFKRNVFYFGILVVAIDVGPRTSEHGQRYMRPKKAGTPLLTLSCKPTNRSAAMPVLKIYLS